MKVVILAGGFGTRISEDTHLKPKPMIEIGGMPILWHIMKLYSHYGYNEFIICAGYKQNIIKEWFANYFLHTSDITFDFTDGNKMIVHNQFSEKWKVTIIDTGLNTMTGGRIKRVQPYLGNEPFFMTYGDGVSDLNVPALLDYHRSHGKIATLTAVNFQQRFGLLDIDDMNTVKSFKEKVSSEDNKINVGFMVLNPEIFNFLDGDETIFEKAPLENLARLGELKAYTHEGFWQCMDTKREKDKLEELWASGNAPWRIWNN